MSLQLLKNFNFDKVNNEIKEEEEEKEYIEFERICIKYENELEKK